MQRTNDYFTLSMCFLKPAMVTLTEGITGHPQPHGTLTHTSVKQSTTSSRYKLSISFLRQPKGSEHSSGILIPVETDGR